MMYCYNLHDALYNTIIFLMGRLHTQNFDKQKFDELFFGFLGKEKIGKLNSSYSPCQFLCYTYIISRFLEHLDCIVIMIVTSNLLELQQIFDSFE